MNKRIQPGHIYFISNGEHVKIGLAVDVKHRLSSLQTGSARLLDHIGDFLVMDTALMEKQAHSHFMPYHFRCEWYALPPSIIDQIRHAEDFEAVMQIDATRPATTPRPSRPGKAPTEHQQHDEHPEDIPFVTVFPYEYLERHDAQAARRASKRRQCAG